MQLTPKNLTVDFAATRAGAFEKAGSSWAVAIWDFLT